MLRTAVSWLKSQAFCAKKGVFVQCLGAALSSLFFHSLYERLHDALGENPAEVSHEECEESSDAQCDYVFEEVKTLGD